MNLTKLTPAETLLITQGDKAGKQELLKYTFMDLLLKEVLTIDHVERRPDGREVRTYKYIYAGKRFKAYAGLAHEMIFLAAFHKSKGMGMLFQHCVKMGYENARSEKSLQKKISTSPMLSRAFSRSLWTDLLGGIAYTDIGTDLKREVERELLDLKSTIAQEMAANRNKAIEKLRAIGGNILLIGGLEFTLMKEIEEELMKELKKSEPVLVDTGGCGTFMTYSHEFDNSCGADSNGWGGDSGCSSGDSSCGSGCGGGCGGGD
ncbi:MAG TPA: hypothetical protein VEB86_08025 [Chryseosolibacter sp.]|nr:hypothetical protein [Chryseosolibacter sp.]